MADATKNCESFSFRLLSQVQKLHSSVAAGLKKHRRRIVCPSKRQNQYSVCQLFAIVHARLSFLSFLPLAFTF